MVQDFSSLFSIALVITDTPHNLVYVVKVDTELLICCRKMDEVHRQVLRENLTYLQDNLSPEEVLDKLFETKIISDDQLMRLRRESQTVGERSCIRELVVYILPKAGSSAFPEFVKALTAKDHTSYISDHLLIQERKVQQRLCEGNSCTMAD